MGSGASGAAKADVLASRRDRLANAASSASSPAPKKKVLEMTFLDELATVRVTRFHERPLGFEISLGVVPIRVDNVYGRGLARSLGVEMGWYLQKVNDIDLLGKEFNEQFAVLKSALAILPAAAEQNVQPTLQSLEIVFEADGKHVPVVFAKKPLGFEFDMIAPISVKTIQEDSVARRHGVDVGWVVLKVAGVDISKMGFMDQVDLLKRSVGSLPDVTYCIAPPLGHSLSANSGSLLPSRSARDAEGGIAEDGDDGRL